MLKINYKLYNNNNNNNVQLLNMKTGLKSTFSNKNALRRNYRMVFHHICDCTRTCRVFKAIFL